MKLKSQPEDFEVEELTDFPLSGGPFAVYLLTKKSLGTPEAITSICERWRIPRHAISYGGLKDKHAVTRQWVTIRRGPRRNLREDLLSLDYQGQASEPFGPQNIQANRFHIILRNLTDDAAERIVSARDQLMRWGVPNYYDDQRFGSLGESNEFIARAWCLGEYERALWLAIAEPNLHDRPNDRQEKEVLRLYWGDWVECKAMLRKSSRRSIVTFLVDHPTRFREAFALVRQDLRSLWLAAFQSDIWNQCLAETLQQTIDRSQLKPIALATADVPFYESLQPDQFEQLRALTLPVPSARLHLEEGPLLDLYERVVAKHGLAMRELRVKYPRDSFFSKGERAGIVLPERLKMDISGRDELNEGRSRLTLQFVLPRGSYATILVKRLTQL